MRTTFVAACCSMLAFGVSAVAEKTESHVRSVDQHGTEIAQERTYEESKNLVVTKKEKLELSKVTNPKGINNQLTEKIQVEQKVASDGDRTMTVTGKDANGTALREVESKTTGKNWKGEATTTTRHVEERDPKGLGNKSVTEVEKETVRHNDGTVTRNKIVNGEEIESERTKE